MHGFLVMSHPGRESYFALLNHRGGGIPWTFQERFALLGGIRPG
jgi:hypothetical protein